MPPARRRRRKRPSRARASAPWLALASILLLTAAVLIVSGAAERLTLFERAVGGLAAKSGAEHAQQAALESPIVIALVAGAGILLLVALVRAFRR